MPEIDPFDEDDGLGTCSCPDCDGSGFDDEDGSDCGRCGGLGYIETDGVPSVVESADMPSSPSAKAGSAE